MGERAYTPKDDQLDKLAEQLHDAYYLDTRVVSTWPPAERPKYLAWRRAAACAIDLGASA